MRPTPLLMDRIWSKVERKDPEQCWPWVAKSRTKAGYGTLKIPGSRDQVLAHRAVVADSYDLDTDEFEEARHTCDNPPCCNPSHLLPGTKAQNLQDMIDRQRYTMWRANLTCCSKGHEYTEANTRWIKNAKGHLCRRCAACCLARSRRNELTRKKRS